MVAQRAGTGWFVLRQRPDPWMVPTESNTKEFQSPLSFQNRVVFFVVVIVIVLIDDVDVDVFASGLISVAVVCPVLTNEQNARRVLQVLRSERDRIKEIPDRRNLTKEPPVIIQARSIPKGIVFIWVFLVPFGCAFAFAFGVAFVIAV